MSDAFKQRFAGRINTVTKDGSLSTPVGGGGPPTAPKPKPTIAEYDEEDEEEPYGQPGGEISHVNRALLAAVLSAADEEEEEEEPQPAAVEPSPQRMVSRKVEPKAVPNPNAARKAPPVPKPKPSPATAKAVTAPKKSQGGRSARASYARMHSPSTRVPAAEESPSQRAPAAAPARSASVDGRLVRPKPGAPASKASAPPPEPSRPVRPAAQGFSTPREDSPDLSRTAAESILRAAAHGEPVHHAPAQPAPPMGQSIIRTGPTGRPLNLVRPVNDGRPNVADLAVDSPGPADRAGAQGLSSPLGSSSAPTLHDPAKADLRRAMAELGLPAPNDPKVYAAFAELGLPVPDRRRAQPEEEDSDDDDAARAVRFSHEEMSMPDVVMNIGGDGRQGYGQQYRAQERPGDRATPPSKPSSSAAGPKERGQPPREQLYFSKQPRQVEWKPKTLDDYKQQNPSKYYQLGKLGPDLDDDELIMKKVKAEQVKYFSKQLREVNRQRAAAAPKKEGKDKPSVVAKAKQEAADARQRRLEFAKQVPKPKPRPRLEPREDQRSEGAELAGDPAEPEVDIEALMSRHRDESWAVQEIKRSPAFMMRA
mmetsp:Transcript_132389/g.300940  ORF Transcript_132389/g.300940 Transcript_132389/m.300940 type:complete len:594 (+) Transcript_132389:58-1839(+)